VRCFARLHALIAEALAPDIPGCIPEPTTYEEAVSGPWAKQWTKAMKQEVGSLRSHETYTLKTIPPGRKAIGVKWVFKVKYTATRAVDRFKARLVAKGFAQRKGLDFDETFTPITCMTSIRTITAVAAAKGLKVEHLDVDSTYLNGIIDKEIYMHQPPGFVDKDQLNAVCLLGKSLYDIKQTSCI
jgi:hypothetical protein